MEELNDRPFLLYLVSLPDVELRKLYSSEPCALAIFRMLTPVSQQCVLQLLFKRERYSREVFVNQNVFSDWRKWCTQRHLFAVMNSLKFLLKMQIVEGSLDAMISLNVCVKSVLTYKNVLFVIQSQKCFIWDLGPKRVFDS